jgi:uncharacterized protein YbcI
VWIFGRRLPIAKTPNMKRGLAMDGQSRREREEEEPFDPIQESEAAAGSPSPQRIADSVAEQLLRIHEQSYGRAARTVKSRFIDDTLIVLMEDLELLPNEEFLVNSGQHETVAHVRSQYQKAIEPTFRAAVERATGRRVRSFSSHVHLEGDEPFIAEIFRLTPE